MTGHAGNAARIAGAVNAQAQTRLAQADEHRAQRIARAGRHAFHTVAALALNRQRNVPGRVEGFCADTVLAQRGLRHRLAHGHGINFLQAAIVVQKQALLRNVDNDILPLCGGGNIGNGGGVRMGERGAECQYADKPIFHSGQSIDKSIKGGNYTRAG